MRIGPLEIENPLFLAPMAGVTDHPFRVLCRHFGAGVVYTEFVSANGVIREGVKTMNLIQFTDDERPIGIQVFGEDPEVIAQSAAYLVDRFRPDIIDLNFGCPVPKVTKKGGGSAMLRDLGLMKAVVQATVQAAGCPVTVKMRAGWDNNSIVVAEAGAIIQQAGGAAITLHPRTTRQSFTGKADWSLIRLLKQSVDIPVIGNGDITTSDDALRMLEETGCDGVMVARGGLGRPWIFREITERLAGGASMPDDIELVITTCRRHFDLLVTHRPERVAVNLTKKHFNWYLKGFAGAAHWRRRIMACESTATLAVIVDELERTFLPAVSGAEMS